VRTPGRRGLTRSVSVGAKPPLSLGAGDRKSTGSVESSQSEKVTIQQHTLAEK
jgi:hypothetical protein